MKALNTRTRSLAHALAEYHLDTDVDGTLPEVAERLRLTRRLSLELSPDQYREFLDRCDKTLRKGWPTL